ncbi:MAG TPA: DUF4440 domain-containing protein [Polyangium sp.]|nr:DUF4440 domain-containing protein [Polyangium sp.]
MPQKNLLRAAMFAFTATGCGASELPPPPVPKPVPDAAPAAPASSEDVANVERAFAATMAKRDFEAFKGFLANETVFISARRALRGKSEVADVWKRFFEGPSAPFFWEPERVEMLDSGSLAFSTGPVRTPDGQIVAMFNSVWRKEPTGWKIIFDRGVDLPECPATLGAANSKPDFVAYRQHLLQAQAAYGKKDFAAFLASMHKADESVPNTARAIYNLACGYALTGKKDEALGLLDKLVQMNLYFDISGDDDLASLRELPRFSALRDAFTALDKKSIGKSTTAFTLPERDMIPEGIVHDPKTGAFFVSSVHLRKILRILPSGKTAEFASKDLFAVLGMAIDEKRRALWACSSAIREMNGFVEADKGRAKVVEFDLDKATVRREISLDEKGVAHMCNDVAVDGEGNVFVSDPVASMLYVLRPGQTALEPYVTKGKFGGPQGIVATSDGKSLFVADYAGGLFHVDRATHETTWLEPPKDAALTGIDGLTSYQGDQLAI